MAKLDIFCFKQAVYFAHALSKIKINMAIIDKTQLAIANCVLHFAEIVKTGLTFIWLVNIMYLS